MSKLAGLLISVFGKSFYRANSTFLLYSAILLFGYGIFIKTAGHIYDADAHLYLGFSLLLAFIQTPIFAFAVYGIWILYSIKSWRFVWKESAEPEQLFWRYSASAMPWRTQFMAWCMYQLYIFLPLLAYWLFLLIYAVVIGSFQVLVITTAFIVVLIVVSAGIYLYRFNDPDFGQKRSNWLLQISRRWKKPLFLVNILNVPLHQKRSYFLVKILSVVMFAISEAFLSDMDKPWLVAYTMSASMVLAHSVLACQEHRFFERHLYFLQQLPLTRLAVFRSFALGALLLLLPECIAYIVYFDSPVALQATLILLSGTVLMRMLNYISGRSVWSFIRYTFGWYVVAMVSLLYDLQVSLIIAQLVISYGIFYNCYYQRDSIAIK